MSSTALESLFKRDRRILIAAIAVLTALAWVYLIWLARGMSMDSPTMPDMPDMPGMDMGGMGSVLAPMIRAWTPTDFAFIFLMWAIMMVGMMAPSAAPMILIYARVARQSALVGKPLATAGWFGCGYILSWIAFSLVATIAQGILERTALLTPMMAAASNRVGGSVLIVAGIYQFTALKNDCLSHCQSPVAFIQSHGGFKKGTWPPIQLGMQHGFYCIGCCWALMALLFVLGVMNVLWIAAIAVHILLEKILPEGNAIARVAGVGLTIAGLWLIFK